MLYIPKKNDQNVVSTLRKMYMSELDAASSILSSGPNVMP